MNQSTLLGNSECALQINKILDGISSHQAWALRFIETWGHEGFLNPGINKNQGLFYDCIDFKHENINGKYCVAEFEIANSNNSTLEFSRALRDALLIVNKKLISGICVPEICSANEIAQLGGKLLLSQDFKIPSLPVCFQKPTFNSFDSFFIFFTAILALLTVASSTYEIVMRRKSQQPKQGLITFSVLTNFDNLIRINKSDSVISCIDGLKAMAAIWIIVGHRRNYTYPYRDDRFSWWDFLIFQVIRSFKYNIDTFFACSAVLMTQSILKSFEKNNFSLIKLYINRYLRYIPVLAFLVMFFMTSIPLMMVQSPNFQKLNFVHYACNTWWYKAFLFIQNFGEPSQKCAEHSWYLSTDYQIFLLSPLIIYGFWSKKHKFIKFAVLLILALQIFTYYNIAFLNVPDFPDVYMLPQYHIGEYLVGILAGYLMYSMKNQKIRISKLKSSIGWTLSLSFLFFQTWYFGNFFNHTPFASIYNSIWRELWVASICWIIFACHYLKSGGFIRKLLSQPFWQPLSRMALCTYLVHYMVLKLVTANQQLEPNFYSWWFLHVAIGDIVVSHFLAAILFVTIEAPAGKLTSLMWEKIDKILEARKIDGYHERIEL